MQDQDIKLELSFEEINIILKALGNLPFNQVYHIIGKIHEQANGQIKPQTQLGAQTPPSQDYFGK